MKQSVLFCLAAVFAAQSLAAQQSVQQQSKEAPRTPVTVPNEAVAIASGAANVAVPSAQPAPLKLRNGALPTGLHGFYDYQSNGMMRGRIMVDKSDPRKVHAACMLALDGTDSASVSSTRRVGYAYSDDAGATWKSTQEIQSGFRLGFPYITLNGQGAPYLAVHGDAEGFGVQTLIYTGTAGATTFSRTGVYDRLSFTSREGDQGAGVIWPAIVTSPKNAAKQVVIATLSPKTTPTREDDDPVHFSVADLGSKGPWDIIYSEPIATSSGGRNPIVTSASGKIGIAYYHAAGNIGGTSGVYFTESTDGGATWKVPVLAIPAQTNDIAPGDTLRAGGNVDLVYNGDDPMIVTTGDINFLYARQGLYLWLPSASTPMKIVGVDSTRALGLLSAVATKAQPSMDYISYPTLCVGNDGQHVAVVFQAAAQTSSEAPDQFQSEDGFYYFRLWAVGSSDGGATWHDPVVVQDFVGEGTDTASIEFPSTAASGTVSDNGMDVPLIFQARSKPGMYAFIVNDISTADGDQPADRGPFSETFQYFQHVLLDPTVFGHPASVGTPTHTTAEAVRITKSFPNPATGSLNVEYHLPHSGDVSIKVYDMLGAEVMNLDDAMGYGGTYNRTLDVAGLASGQYRLVIAQNGVRATQSFNVIH